MMDKQCRNRGQSSVGSQGGCAGLRKQWQR